MNNIIKQAAEVKKKNIPFSLDSDAFYGLVSRVAGKKYADYIKVEKICSESGFDEYSVENAENGIKIKATSGSVAAFAFNRYLREICGYYISIKFKVGVLPDEPPKLKKSITGKSAFHYRYFMNFCTYGYSYAFYEFDTFEDVLDRILLSGFNMILNPVAQEYVWFEFLKKLGYTSDEAKSYLASTAFMPWFLMGNLSNYNGKCSDNWLERRKKFAGQINKRLLEFGCSALMCGYSGMVPEDIQRLFPDSNPILSKKWCGLSRPAIISGNDKNFDKIAETFYDAQLEIPYSNKMHYYAADAFHEGSVPIGVDTVLYAEKIFNAMNRKDENAVWVLQGWGNNPRREMVKAVDQSRILVQNLLSQKNFNGKDNFADSPWIYCTVNNFGGQHLLRGNAERSLKDPFVALDKDKYTCLGIGYMPESTETDEIFFDIVSRVGMRDTPINFEVYLKEFLKERYGFVNEEIYKAWKMLCDYTYDSDDISSSGESSFCCRPTPTADRVSTWGKTSVVRDHTALKETIKILMKYYDALKSSEAYMYDLVDFTRQLMANDSWKLVYGINQTFAEKDKKKFLELSNEFLHRFDLMENLLKTHSAFLLGNWLERAKRLGSDELEKSWLEWQARRIITVWANKSGDELHDYAAREYSGMISDFYKVRWERYISALKISLYTGDEAQLLDSYEVEAAFGLETKKFPTNTSGDTYLAVKSILELENIGSV